METAVKENKKREQKSFKKKIIPVQSDSSESASSSPSPAGSPQPQSQTMSLSSRSSIQFIDFQQGVPKISIQEMSFFN